MVMHERTELTGAAGLASVAAAKARLGPLEQRSDTGRRWGQPPTGRKISGPTEVSVSVLEPQPDAAVGLRAGPCRPGGERQPPCGSWPA